MTARLRTFELPMIIDGDSTRQPFVFVVDRLDHERFTRGMADELQARLMGFGSEGAIVFAFEVDLGDDR
jgi:hypothetical protein